MELWDSEQGPMLPLAPVIGQALMAIGLFPDRMAVYMRFEQHVILARPVASVGLHALSVTIGLIKTDADFSQIEQLTNNPQPALIGKRLSGMDENVFVFDGDYGVLVAPSGIRIVQRADSIS